MELKDLLADPLKIHDWGLPQLIRSGLSEEAYARIAGLIGDGSRTIETGMGISTVVFAWKRSHHICIAPDPAEQKRLQNYCLDKGVVLDRVDFRLERSEKVLANLNAEPLDLALVDGCHGFPVAFMDFYYLSTMLKIGGCLVLDDIHLWTGRVLVDFLRHEPEWELDRVYEKKTAFFVKSAAYDPGKEWDHQPYVMRHSPKPPRFGQLCRALGYAARGDWATIGRKIREKVRGRES